MPPKSPEGDFAAGLNEKKPEQCLDLFIML